MDYLEARGIAKVLYVDRSDRHGLPEYDHLALVDLYLEYSHNDNRVVAMLHDCIEDGLVSISTLCWWGVTDAQCAALELISRNDDETYSDYIQRIVDAEGYPGKIAREVKIADLRANIDRRRETNSEKRIEKRYIPALEKLLGISSH